MGFFSENSAQIESSAVIGEGSKIWHFAHIREFAQIGENSIIGRGVYVGSGVRIGEKCKVQNGSMIYEPAVLENGVFIGPGVILTNDRFPRAVNVDMTLKNPVDWRAVGVHVREGASIGAGSICIAPVVIGRWSLVAAGSVVSRDVPDYALVAGVPAKQVGWVGRNGTKLEERDGRYVCTVTGEVYELTGEKLKLKGDL